MATAVSGATFVFAGSRWELAWRILSIAAVAYLVVRWALLLPDQGGAHSVDARTYWSASLDDPYSGPQIGLPGAYLYSPAFLQILTPLRLLPWEAFHALWVGLGVAALAFLIGPIGGAIAITALPFVYRDLFVGNIHLMLGAAIVLGLRFPAVWAFPLLTKITPGIGLFWFVGRRDWGRLAWAVAVTSVISGASFALAPDLWVDWGERLRMDGGTAGNAYLAITAGRIVFASVLVTLAAWRGHAWLVPIAVVIALPILWPDSLAILLACFPLLRSSRRTSGSPV